MDLKCCASGTPLNGPARRDRMLAQPLLRGTTSRHRRRRIAQNAQSRGCLMSDQVLIMRTVSELGVVASFTSQTVEGWPRASCA